MFKITDTVDGGGARLLYLSSTQARIVATSTQSMNRMLDELLEGSRPQLVINLLTSHGFRDFTMCQDRWAQPRMSFAPGVVYAHPPFVSAADEQDAESRIDLFMSEVLIPLAERTSAVVICTALTKMCVLSAAFTRMVAAQSAKWAGRPPFTVLSMADNFHDLYHNRAGWGAKPSAHWRVVREASRTWKQRDAQSMKAVSLSGKYPCNYEYFNDLDPHAAIYLLVDPFTRHDDRFYNEDVTFYNFAGEDREAFGLLISSLVRHLSQLLPSLALKTGASKLSDQKVGKGNVKDAAALNVAMDMVQCDVPVLFLDVRKRPAPPQLADASPASRQLLIDFAQRSLQAGGRALAEHAPRLCDTFDTCALSYLHDALMGDGSPLTAETLIGDDDEFPPLHEAIRRKSGGEAAKSASAPQLPPRASKQQISQAADTFVDWLLEEANEMLGMDKARCKQAHERMRLRWVRLPPALQSQLERGESLRPARDVTESVSDQQAFFDVLSQPAKYGGVCTVEKSTFNWCDGCDVVEFNSAEDADQFGGIVLLRSNGPLWVTRRNTRLDPHATSCAQCQHASKATCSVTLSTSSITSARMAITTAHCHRTTVPRWTTPRTFITNTSRSRVPHSCMRAGARSTAMLCASC